MASPEVKRRKSCDDDVDGDNDIETTVACDSAETKTIVEDDVLNNGDTQSDMVGGTGNEAVKQTTESGGDNNQSNSAPDNETSSDQNQQNESSVEVEEEEEEEELEHLTSASEKLEKKFKYRFNADGQLRHISSGEVFQFDVFGDRAKNQRRYEEIGELMNLIIYELLETSVHLRRISIPLDADENEPTGFVFASEDFETNPKLLVLIHGSGVVRAGQWARRLIMNDCLDSGTQLPFIREAQKMGFATLVLNTNQNSVPARGANKLKDTQTLTRQIRGSENAMSHGCYVWENLIMKRKNLTDVVVVAHSFGGVVTTEIAAGFPEFWYSRVKALALTDSVHGERAFTLDRRLRTWFASHAVNWVTSDRELDTPLRRSSTVPCVSAGHTSHENTSWSAFKSIFTFFKKKLETISE